MFGILRGARAVLVCCACVAFAAAAGEWPPESYLVYYGGWDDEKIAKAHDFDLVVLHPGEILENIDAVRIKRIRDGRDRQAGTADDVLIISYLSIGEIRQVPRGPRLVAEGAGPVAWEEGKGVVPRHAGYESWYIDQLSYVFKEPGLYQWGSDGMPATTKGQDGMPDENGKWNSFFVNAGDPAWRERLETRMKEINAKLAPDGFFLDTLDTASPWGNYGWMQEAMARLVRRLKGKFPDKYMIANRGLFLFEKYGDLMSAGIDGLMFESFVSEWDWYRKLGVDHPWLGSNWQVLIKSVLPHAVKPKTGFHLFFLNYVNPRQDDYFTILFSQQALLRGITYSAYVSSPSLDRIFPPPTSYYAAPGASHAPAPRRLTAKDEGRGRFSIALEVETPAGAKPTLGQEVFLDLRLADRALAGRKIALARRIKIDYQHCTWRQGGGGLAVEYNDLGVAPGKRYFLYAKLHGRRPDDQTAYLSTALATIASPGPALVEGIKGEGREASVLVTWQKPRGVAGFNVYSGKNARELAKVGSAQGSSFTVGGLRNGRGYYFAIVAVDAQGREGPLARPVLAFPKDCTPPLPPTDLRVIPSIRHTLFVTWKLSPSKEVGGYRVYCFPSEQRLRYPLMVNSGTTKTVVANLEPGREYTVFVTAIDFQNNQSQAHEIKTVVAK